jgi:hypothetical protein
MNSLCKFITYILLFGHFTLLSQKETDFIPHIHSVLGGEREVTMYGGRADLVNEEYAIEIELAHKWKNSIGQALWYGQVLNKKPGIVLIITDMSQRKYAIQLQSALDHAGMGDKIKLWLYPEDFGGIIQSNTINASSSSDLSGDKFYTTLRYSLNKKSGVRHNSNCAHFECKNCEACGPEEWKKGCGQCGG